MAQYTFVISRRAELQLLEFEPHSIKIFGTCRLNFNRNQYSRIRISDFRLSDIPFHSTCGDVPQKADRMSQSVGQTSVEAELVYVEQQRQATATDVQLFRHRRHLAAKKGRRRRSK
jgi:hypothetical protein